MSETTLNAQLKMKGITDIYVCGLAYDVCVGATAVDAISSGYRTILLDDCCRGVDLKDIESVKEKVVSTNGVIVTSKDVWNGYVCIHHIVAFVSFFLKMFHLFIFCIIYLFDKVFVFWPENEICTIYSLICGFIGNNNFVLMNLIYIMNNFDKNFIKK